MQIQICCMILDACCMILEFCHNLFTLMAYSKSVWLLLWNILFYFILPWKSMGSNVARTTTFFKISSLVFCRRKKVIQVWNDMRMVNNGGLKRTFREQKHLHLTLTVFWCKIPPHPVLCLIGKATVYKLMKEGLAFSTVNTFITRDR